MFILRKVELVGFFVFFLRGEARWRVVGQFLEKGSGFLEIATMYFTSRAFMICLCTNWKLPSTWNNVLKSVSHYIFKVQKENSSFGKQGRLEGKQSCIHNLMATLDGELWNCCNCCKSLNIGCLGWPGSLCSWFLNSIVPCISES